jgi:putative polymerase
MLLAWLLPVFKARPVIFLLPVLTVLALTIAGSIHELQGIKPSILSDNLPGRLLFSGRLLNDWTLQNWLGLSVSPVYTSDTGFAYLINNLGLPLGIFLLAIFAFHPVLRQEAAGMKAMVGIYFAASLCIGASVFSIKTAALLWFLYGTANAAVYYKLETPRPCAAAPGSVKRYADR